MVKNHLVVSHISYLLQRHSNDALQVRKYLKISYEALLFSGISGSFWNYFLFIAR